MIMNQPTQHFFMCCIVDSFPASDWLCSARTLGWGYVRYLWTITDLHSLCVEEQGKYRNISPSWRFQGAYIFKQFILLIDILRNCKTLVRIVYGNALRSIWKLMMMNSVCRKFAKRYLQRQCSCSIHTTNWSATFWAISAKRQRHRDRRLAALDFHARGFLPLLVARAPTWSRRRRWWTFTLLVNWPGYGILPFYFHS